MSDICHTFVGKCVECRNISLCICIYIDNDIIKYMQRTLLQNRCPGGLRRKTFFCETFTKHSESLLQYRYFCRHTIAKHMVSIYSDKTTTCNCLTRSLYYTYVCFTCFFYMRSRYSYCTNHVAHSELQPLPTSQTPCEISRTSKQRHSVV